MSPGAPPATAAASPLMDLWGRLVGGRLELSPALAAGATHQDGALAVIFGRLQRVDRLHGAHRLPAGPPAGLLLRLARAAGPARALAQLEGSFCALIFDGERLSLARDRLGQLGWWWRPCAGGVAFAAHPAALGPLDPAALRAVVAGAPSAWPLLRRVGAGELLQVGSDGGAALQRWWSLSSPPAGRGGARAAWDRAAAHARSLAALRAREAAAFGAAARAAPRVQTAGRTDRAVPRWRAALPEPLLSATAEALLPALAAHKLETLETSTGMSFSTPPAHTSEAQGGWAWPAGPCLPLTAPSGALFGAGLPRMGAGPAWSAWVQGPLIEQTLLPLGSAALAWGMAPPAVEHADPALLEVLSQVPEGHLRGLRRSLGARLGLPAGPMSAAEPPEEDVPEGVRAVLGPSPQDPTGRARWTAAARWATALSP